MGMLVNGAWLVDDTARKFKDGRFRRAETQFRDRIEATPGARFAAEAGRYHLYVSLACPWAHRTLIVRKLMGLEAAITLSVVDPFMGEMGWEFTENPGSIPDTVNGARYVHEIYQKARPDYTGRCSVPVLWDKKYGTIVNNESAEIIRMFNQAFRAAGFQGPDLYPAPLRAEIDAVNARVYEHVNNGVYKCGFARTQEAYDEAFAALFATLDELEARLARGRYLVGDRVTEADWRLFTTLVRFDPVYVSHFKCNRRRLADYPNLWNYTRELYQIPGVAETVSLEHIKHHYFQSHQTINPFRIVAGGPEVDFGAPHNRARLAA